MIFGRRDHRKLQRKSAKKTEVRDLDSLLKEFKYIVETFFSSCSDLDSAVSSGGLDEVLAPSAGQTPNLPKTRSFFQSVTVTKLVKPDGVREKQLVLRFILKRT